ERVALRTDGGVGVRELVGEGAPERARFALDAPRTDQELREIFAPIDAMPKALEPRVKEAGPVGRARRRRPHPRQELLELGADRLHVTERDARRGESDELSIVPSSVAVDEVDGIGGAPRREVLARADGVERLLESRVRRRHSESSSSSASR